MSLYWLWKEIKVVFCNIILNQILYQQIDTIFILITDIIIIMLFFIAIIIFIFISLVHLFFSYCNHYNIISPIIKIISLVSSLLQQKSKYLSIFSKIQYNFSLFYINVTTGRR